MMPMVGFAFGLVLGAALTVVVITCFKDIKWQ